MQPDSPVPTSWQSVAAELRACRDHQQATWGDLDHALIGRYLAGEVSPQERALVEASLDRHPELRVLTEVVSEVLGESTQAPVEEPVLLSFKNRKPSPRSRFQRYQGRFALAAAACLLLGLSVALNPFTSPSNSIRVLDENGFSASRRNAGNERLKSDSLSDLELFARADALVEKDEFEKAAKLLFAQSDKAEKGPIRPVSRSPKSVARFNHSVAKLTERVLESMKDLEAETKDANPPAIAPRTPKHVDKVGVTALKPSNDSAALRSQIISQSVPYLVNALNQQDDAALRDRCTSVLKQLGPRARQAESELEELARKGCEKVSPKAREALSYVRRPFWIGVQDRARVLNDMTRARLNQRMNELSKKHQIYIVAETVKSLPTEVRKHFAAFDSEDKKNDTITKWAEKRCQAAAAERGVYVLICMDPPAVQVTVCPEMRKRDDKGWSKDTVQARVQDSMKKHDLDKGLEDVVQMIEQAIVK